MAPLPRMFLLLLGLSYASSAYSQTTSTWANFDYELLSDDTLIVLPDSVIIPYLDKYDAIIRFDYDYYYLRNRNDMFMNVYILNDDFHDLMSGQMVYNHQNYFIYSRNWSYQEDAWRIRVRRLGDEALGDAECIGYDDRSLLVVINDDSYHYDYTFNLLSNVSDLECSIYP